MIREREALKFTEFSKPLAHAFANEFVDLEIPMLALTETPPKEPPEAVPAVSATVLPDALTLWIKEVKLAVVGSRAGAVPRVFHVIVAPIEVVVSAESATQSLDGSATTASSLPEEILAPSPVPLHLTAFARIVAVAAVSIPPFTRLGKNRIFPTKRHDNVPVPTTGTTGGSSALAGPTTRAPKRRPAEVKLMNLLAKVDFIMVPTSLAAVN